MNKKHFKLEFPVICFHRGYSKKAPENTLASFSKAVDNGARMIEFDVRLTKDEKVVIIHDINIQRVSNGFGLIPELTINYLKQLDFGSWFSDYYKGEKIISLDELFSFFKNSIFYNIEIKTDRDKKRIEILANAIIRIIEYNELSDNVFISSFDKTALLLIKNLNHNILTGLLADNHFQSFGALKFINENKIDALICNHKIVNLNKIQKVHTSNKYIFAYTVDNNETINKLINLGIDGIITNGE